LKEYGSIENILENADKIKGSLGEKVRNGKESAIMSKKLARIITNVPVEFHEEQFCLKEWNKPALIEVFTELEFKTLGKRVLGEEFNVFQTAPVGVQTDLFGNVVEQAQSEKSKVKSQKEESTTVSATNGENEAGFGADKNINNTQHNYILADTEEKIAALVKDLLQQTEICFDTGDDRYRCKRCGTCRNEFFLQTI
jgi:DNA polymerase-1